MASTHLTADEQHALDALLALPEGQASRVALAVLEQRGGDVWLAPDPHAQLEDDEFAQELSLRAQSVEDGTAELIPADRVYAEIRDMLAQYGA